MGRLCSPTWYCAALLAIAIAYCAVPTTAASDQQTQTAPTVPAAVAPAPAPLISITDSTPPDLEHQGDLLRGQKRYLDATDYYNAAIEKEATAVRYNKLGMSLLFLQRNKDAEKAFNKALKMDPNCAEALNNRGFVEQLKKNYSRASRYYEKALAIRPNAPTFHYNLGSVYFARHRYDQAAQEYRSAYQLDPDIFNRVSRMGVMAQTSSPEDRAAFSFMVAKMYAQAGDFDNCLQYLRKAMEEGYKGIDKIYTDSEFATLRTDKRFTDLMTQKPQALP